MFVVVLTYQVPVAEVEPHMEAHMAFIDRHYASGTFLASGRRVPRIGGVILATAPDEAALREILAEDPFIAHGVASAEVIEFAPTRAAPDLSGLVGR